MKKSRLILMLLISLVLAVGAALVAKHWLQDRMAAHDAGPKGTPVAVATMRIPFGQKVGPAQVRLVDLPPSAVPKGSFSKVDAVLGRVATQTIYPGEVLLTERVVEHLSGSALAAVVAKGKRAITVRVNDVVGVAGFLLPGSRVDVIASRRHGNSVSTDIALSDLKVLAVDQDASRDKDKPVVVRAVTLEVTPRQAEQLVKATQEGQVQLTLRNPLDKTLVADASDFEAPSDPPKPASVKKTPVKVARKAPISQYDPYVRVTVIRGTDVSTTRVEQ